MGCCDPDEDSKREITGERRCTDVCWLCLFIAFWCLMVVIAAFSFVYGNPVRLINGYDSFGNTCGTKNNRKIGHLENSGLDTSDRPNLIFFDINELRNSLKICVKHCPPKTFRKIEELGQYYRQAGVGYCNYKFNYGELDSSSSQKWDTHVLSTPYGPCPMLPLYESIPVLNRCVPKPVKEISDAILSNLYGILNNWDTLEKVLADLYSTKYIIFGLVFLSLILSLVIISILHLMAYIVSYVIMILFTIASILGTSFLWYTYFDIKYNLDHTKQSMWLWESARNEEAFFWYSVVATIITIIILLIVFVLRKQVGFLADLFQETAKCLGHIPMLFFQPIITFIILVLFFIFWVFVVLCLATSYYPDTSGITLPFDEKTTFTTSTIPVTTQGLPMGNLSFTDKIKKLTLVEYIDPAWVKYMWWVYFIGLIWTSEFIMACQQMVIAGAVAHWFYRHKFKDNSHVSYGISKLLKYHLGSVALGSFIITLFKVPRLILTYLHEKLRYQENKGSECAACCLKCCICCFYCMEKFIRYLNHNAYTVIAIDGVGFCKAAGIAFEVLTSHALQVATINGLGDFILFLGKCLVTAITGSVGLYIFRKNGDLEFYAVPTLVVCIFAFFVAHCILSLYEMVLDTVYLCMAQNGEAPDGIQMQNMGITHSSNGNNTNPPSELEPIK